MRKEQRQLLQNKKGNGKTVSILPVPTTQKNKNKNKINIERKKTSFCDME